MFGIHIRNVFGLLNRCFSISIFHKVHELVPVTLGFDNDGWSLVARLLCTSEKGNNRRKESILISVLNMNGRSLRTFDVTVCRNLNSALNFTGSIIEGSFANTTKEAHQ